MSTHEAVTRFSRRSGGLRRRPVRRDLVAAILVAALLIAAPSPWVVRGQETPSPEPASDRPILAAPLPAPAGPAPAVSPEGPPTASVERHGVRLDLWIPTEPVSSGAWVSALLRVTNVGEAPIRVPGYPDNILCQSPISSRIDLGGLWSPGVDWSGNAGIFKAVVLDGGPATVSMDVVGLDPGAICLDVGLPAGRLRAGASFDLPLQAWVRYLWRDQPLPTGTASVASRFTFYRSAPGRAGRRTSIEVRAPLAIAGTDVAYPSPQALVDAALMQPEFLAWIETRDFGQEWSPAVNGIEPPRGLSFAEVDPLGGPAPDETVEIGAFAEGSVDDSWGRVIIDPWDASVEEVIIAE